MSTVIPPNYLDNILSCGYIRDYEQKNNFVIPNAVQSIIVIYCKQYSLYGIGWNSNSSKHHPLNAINKLISNTNDIFVNAYGLNITSISNQLYVSNNRLNQLDSVQTSNIPSIQFTSSGIANNKHLFVYTNNGKLYKSTVKSNQINNCKLHKICSELTQIHTTFITNQYDSIIDIKCGLNHALFLTKLGNVYANGLNDVGQCGFDRNKFANISTPKLMMQSITAVACGCFHSLLIDNKQQLIVCGYNYCGQLGVKQQQKAASTPYMSDSYDSETNSLELIETDGGADDVDVIGSFEIADESEGDSESDWSDNVINLVIDVPSVNGYFRALNVKMSKVYAGKFHSVCIASDGTCFSFGHNAFGNLGNGEISDWGQSNPIPQQIEIKGNEESFVEGSCGENHNLLLTARNNIICFGDNSNNQCSVINKNKVIKCPFVVNKRQEFGIESNCFIEKIYCLKNESLIFIDPYKIF